MLKRFWQRLCFWRKPRFSKEEIAAFELLANGFEDMLKLSGMIKKED